MFADRGKTRHCFATKEIIFLSRVQREMSHLRVRQRATALSPIVTLSVGFADTSPKGEAQRGRVAIYCEFYL